MLHMKRPMNKAAVKFLICDYVKVQMFKDIKIFEDPQNAQDDSEQNHLENFVNALREGEISVGSGPGFRSS